MTAAVHEPRTLAAIIEAVLAQKSGVLLRDDAEQYTADETRTAVDRLAGGLAHLGVTPGARVALLASGSCRHALAFLACQRLGAVPCALHLREPVARIAESIAWLEADAVLADADQEERVHEALAATRRPVPVVGLGDRHDPRSAGDAGELVRCGPTPPPPRAARADDLAAILLSSGTTGRPKATLNLQGTLHATALAGASVFGDIDEADAVLVAVAPSAAAWFHVVMPFLAARATLHFLGRFEARGWLDTVVSHRISHTALVPTMWRRVLAEAGSGEDLSHVRLAFFAGEVGSDTLIAGLRSTFPRAEVRTGYLSAEGGCAPACVARERTLVDEGKAASTGRPVAGAEARVVAPGAPPDELVVPGETGEILVRSASVAPGYWKAPELTSARFVDGWWRSGDVGRLDDDGDVFVQGRTDHVIKTGGLKVHAEEVEDALMLHPDVSMAAVVAEPDQDWGQAIVAYVVATRPGLAGDDVLAYPGLRARAGRHRPVQAPEAHSLPRRAADGADREALPPGPDHAGA